MNRLFADNQDCFPYRKAVSQLCSWHLYCELMCAPSSPGGAHGASRARAPLSPTLPGPLPGVP